MLRASPNIAQPSKLVHLPSQEFSAGRENLSFTALVVHTMNMHSPRCAHTIADESRPLNQWRITTQLNELCNGIGVRKAQVRRLNLP